MGERISSWFASVGSTQKAIAVLIAVVSITITATLAVAQQVGIPARMDAVEAAVDTLRAYAAENRAGIREVRKNTETILCIMSLPESIPPAESRLRCP